jgi:hypothetical protein
VGGLEGRDDSVEKEHEPAEGADQQAASVPEPLPDQIPATDLADPAITNRTTDWMTGIDTP